MWHLWKVKESPRQESTEILSLHMHWFGITTGHVARCSGSFVVIEHYFATSDFKSSKIPTVRRNDDWEHVVISYFLSCGLSVLYEKFYSNKVCVFVNLPVTLALWRG
jgi:hypothetical protein